MSVYINGVEAISSIVQTALNLKAPLASPQFTGTVTLPAVTLGATITFGGGWFVLLSVDNQALLFEGGSGALNGSGATIALTGKNAAPAGAFRIWTPNTATNASVLRLLVGDGDTADITFSNCLIKANLPVANPGAGYLWNDTGTVKVGT